MKKLAETKKVDFEKNIANLEKIVADLEKGEMSLDSMLGDFESGIKLARECTKALDDAEKKISILTKKPSGEMQEEKFNEE